MTSNSLGSEARTARKLVPILLGFIDPPMSIPLILMLMASISDGKKDFIACIKAESAIWGRTRPDTRRYRVGRRSRRNRQNES